MNLDHELENMIGDRDVKVPGLGVIIYKDGVEVYSKFLGSRTLQPDKNITRDTRFRIASVSKMFTIFTIMQLVEQKKIDLDEDASLYLNFQLRNPKQSASKITVRMLADHTSSLRDGKIYSIPPDVSIKEFFNPRSKFFEDGAHFSSERIGEYFSYCNLNYGILGTIIEKVTGQRFDIYQKENILSQLETDADYVVGNLSQSAFKNLGTIYRKQNPAGIWNENTGWFGKIDDFRGNQPDRDTIFLQNAYSEDFQNLYDLKKYVVGTNATIFSPQGGLRISFEELSHVLEMLMNDGIYRGHQILSSSSIQEIFKRQWIYKNQNGDTYNGIMLNYGLGAYRIDGTSSARVCKDYKIDLIGHTGAAFGLLSGIFLRPNTKTGFIYIMNGEAISEDTDIRSRGVFSSNYIWEENLMNSICNFLSH